MNTDTTATYTYLPEARVVKIDIFQMFNMVDLLTEPKGGDTALALYRAFTDPEEWRKIFTKPRRGAGFQMHIGKLGTLKPVLTIPERYAQVRYDKLRYDKVRYDKFWTPAFPPPDDRARRDHPLYFIPLQLSLDKALQAHKPDISDLVGEGQPIEAADLSGYLRIYPPGTGVVRIDITLAFQEQICVDTVASIANNIDYLYFVHPEQRVRCDAFLEDIVAQVDQALFSAQTPQTSDRRWEPPEVMFILPDSGTLDPTAKTDALALLVSKALAQQEQDIYPGIHQHIEQAVHSDLWKEGIFAVADHAGKKNAALFFVSNRVLAERRADLLAWIRETYELVSAGAYAQLAFARRIEPIAQTRIRRLCLPENRDELCDLASLLRTMRQVMLALYSIKTHLERQGSDSMLDFATDIWKHSNPVDLSALRKHLRRIKKALEQHRDDETVGHMYADLEEIQDILSPFPEEYEHDRPAPGDEEAIQHLEELLETKTQRLQLLEIRQARQGIEVDPSVPMEIEQIKGEIEGIKGELHQL